QMLAYPGNRNFAAGLVDYLVEDDAWGPRGGSLYILTNRFRQTGRYGKADGLSDELTQTARNLAESLDGWHRDGLPSSVARALGGAAALTALLLLALTSLRRYQRATPSYAAPISALAQGGLSGRAAVLSAPTTDRALVVAELTELLREELVRMAGLPVLSSHQAALAEFEKRGVPKAWLTRCREALKFGELAENALRAQRRSGISVGQVTDQERRVTELLVDLERSGHK
ncbi:MAG TPA: hypothetical protein VFQ61_35130, partial [Polyangiaceae bacterium]|nr:hypothetical protein [Polyangiaceae bacterium]